MIINYCSGGIGNRLKPFSSCYVISKLTGRNLGAMWYPTMRCRAKLENLFTNTFEDVNIHEIYESNSVTIYSHREWVDHDFRLNGNPILKNLADKYGVHSVDNSANITKDSNKFIIVYSNDFLNGFERSDCIEFFKSLNPISKIKENVNKKIVELELDKSVIGVHARGTDFEPGGITVHTYINKMQDEYNKNTNVKFLVCSDSKDYESDIKSAFPNNTLFNKKDHWVYKNNGHGGWVNNVETPEESVQDSLVDMYLLSKTNFKIYHPESTFAQVVSMIQ